MRRITKRIELSSDASNFIDSEIVIEKGKVVRFSINLTSIINDKEFPLVRFDCAHGCLHEHRFFSKNPFRKNIDEEISGELITKLTNDLICNWKKHRELFIENHL